MAYKIKSSFKGLDKFVIFNSVIFFIIGLIFLVNSNLQDSMASVFYLLLVDIGHIALLPFICYPILLLFYTITKWKKLTLILGAIFSFFGIIYLSIDLMVYMQYHFHLNKFIFDMIFGGGADEIFQFPLSTYIYVSLFILAIIFVEFLLIRWSLSNRLSKINIKKVFITIFVSMLLGHLVHAYSYAVFYNPVVRAGKVYPLYFPLTANSFLAKFNLVDTDKLRDKQAMKKHKGNSTMYYPKKSLVFNKEHNPYNVLFVMIDCWRGDTFTPELTPNMYKLASKSQLFLNHYSGSCGTRSSIFSIFYSLPAFAYWDTVIGISKGPIYLQTLLQQNYKMGIFASATLSNPPFDRTVFADIPNLRTHTNTEINKPWARDVKAQEEYLNFIDNYKKTNTKEPFFAFLFYDAVHGYSSPNPGKGPFQPALEAPNYLALNNDYNPEPFFNLYKNILHETDKRIGIVLEDLEQKGLLENTIIVFSGDHGQEFNDNKNNYWGHSSNYSKAQTYIPLMVYWPNKEPHVYKHKTMHYDIIPTLMAENQGCTNSFEDYAIGFSLFNETKRPFYVAGSFDSYAIIEDDKIITINYGGNYNVTDLHMNTLENQNINSKRIREIFKSINRFYRN